MKAMFAINDTNIRGFVELQPAIRMDTRGSFIKTFHQQFFAANNLATSFCEQYYSLSKQGVLRGLHFQLPPHDQAKLVFCVVGEILDVAVDLRTDSPTFGEHAKIILSAERANLAYLTTGLAHGFYVLSDSAIIVYNVTTVYAPAYDAGIRWDKAGVQWPDPSPIISERDAAFPSLAEFCSPFRTAVGRS
jgi:dTDP-4-dehydrorhamnose 3,5-epimerase